MTRGQIDSVKAMLNQHNLNLDLDTLAYDNHERIKEIGGSVDTKDQYYPFITSDFKGLTIISRGDSITVIMGILPAPKKK